MTLFHKLGLCALFATLFLTSSCDPAVILGPQAQNADKYDLRISYFQGACYGRCEVYRLDVYDNGLLVFKGERFTERPGVWQKSIDRRRIVSVIDSFERADFQNYPRAFRSQIPDAPSREITFYDEEGEGYTTSFKESATPELENLALKLRRLAEMPNYRPVSDTIPGLNLRPKANKEREEIIVELQAGTRVETWLVNYGKQNVQFKQRLSPNGNYYLITADPNLMGADELLGYLRKDASVLSAQRNQAVNPR
ncbi:DUF6438 domain-containing protein [Neolewinella agarilytica]|uniref:DUF6438 domain-containing protein n=1 Tax=Neolewinella agarilytica TaxID=478744 RepID=UPI0023567EA8|nr:DUF6438 domain-containing protein [Neolewinella agarilytica]